MRKIKILITLTLFSGLIWYIFIKPHDYIVKFKTKTSPGNLLTSVENWNAINQRLDSFSYKITNKNAYTFINETINIKGMSLDLNWRFESINDSITQTVVGITEKDRYIYNRITAPFFDTQFKKIVITTIKDFKNGIENALENKFKANFIGIDTIPKMNYAYLEFKDINMNSKAQKMMQHNGRLLQFINFNNLREGEIPFLIINKWDIQKSIIDFRFCFPIKLKDSMPVHQDIKFDILKPIKALKANYFGNYITSDRGWFTLHEYAKRHNVTIENNPIEFFLNNPHDGGKEIDWKAEIYMPLKN